MSEEIKKDEEKKVTTEQSKAAETSSSAATARYRETYARTRNHRAAVYSYCAGNVWATENAKAVGNW